jgi:MFS family permease
MSDAPTDAAPPLWHRVGVALTHRNFRILWFAALGSTIGTWMQQYAQGLLVSRLTNKSFYLGLDGALGQLPILLFMLVGGVVADRYDKRKLLTGSQYVQAFSAFTLALLVYTDQIRIWHILLMSFVSGCGQAFGGPAYQSMIPSLVPRKDLPNAIALNSTQFNLSRVLGPTFGTGVILSLGTAACFGINGVSFFLVIFALASLRLPPHLPATTMHKPIREDLAIGLNYVRTNRLTFTLTVLVAITTFLITPVITLLPILAYSVFSDAAGTPETRLATLFACQGLGAIVGALSVGSAGRFKGMGKTLFLLQIVLGAVVIAFALTHVWAVNCVLMFVMGIVFMAVFSISFSIIQLAVPDDLRGRVVSIYMVALRAGGPLGGLVTGALADVFTAPKVLAVNGAAVALIALAMLVSGRGRAVRDL